MKRDGKHSRRDFVKLCASAVATASASPGLLAREGGVTRQYTRAKLVDRHGVPFTADRLTTGENFLFHYPHVSTPCFLIDLGEPAVEPTLLVTENGELYEWQGGVGPERSIVAFSAICAHRMTHPAKSVSFINYRHETVSYWDGDKQLAERSKVIYCCSEKSVYDPRRGAQVLGGPAPQPLATILLEHDPGDGTLHATGTYGGVMFDQYFQKFADRLVLEHGTDDIREPVDRTAVVMHLDDYCSTQILC